MAFEDFTTQDSNPLKNFEREAQEILARELLLEIPPAAPTNGEAALKDDDFIEFSLEETQSLYGLEGNSGSHDAPAHAGEQSSLDVKSLAQLQHLVQALGQDATAAPAAADVRPAALPPEPAALPPERAISPGAAAGAAPSMDAGGTGKQMTEMLKAMGPIAESLAPVMQEVLPQLIEQVGPMMEEMVPMVTEAVGGLASAI